MNQTDDIPEVPSEVLLDLFKLLWPEWLVLVSLWLPFLIVGATHDVPVLLGVGLANLYVLYAEVRWSTRLLLCTHMVTALVTPVSAVVHVITGRHVELLERIHLRGLHLLLHSGIAIASESETNIRLLSIVLVMEHQMKNDDAPYDPELPILRNKLRKSDYRLSQFPSTTIGILGGIPLYMRLRQAGLVRTERFLFSNNIRRELRPQSSLPDVRIEID